MIQMTRRADVGLPSNGPAPPASALSPTDATFMAQRVRVHFEQGNWEAAADVVRQAEALGLRQESAGDDQFDPRALPLGETGLAVRTQNMLADQFGVLLLGELAALPDDELHKARNMGVKTMAAIDAELARYGLARPAPSEPDDDAPSS